MSLHGPIVHSMLTREGRRTMIIWCTVTELLQCKVNERCGHVHFSGLLRCNNSVRTHQIIMVLCTFFSSSRCTVRVRKLILNWTSCIFFWFEPINWFHMVWALLIWDFMAYISEAIGTGMRNIYWYNTAFFKCKNKFLTSGCNRCSKQSIWLPDWCIFVWLSSLLKIAKSTTILLHFVTLWRFAFIPFLAGPVMQTMRNGLFSLYPLLKIS